MIRPVEFSPRIDSVKVVELATQAGRTITIGEADEYLKNNIAYLADVLQDVLEDEVFVAHLG